MVDCELCVRNGAIGTGHNHTKILQAVSVLSLCLEQIMFELLFWSSKLSISALYLFCAVHAVVRHYRSGTEAITLPELLHGSYFLGTTSLMPISKIVLHIQL